MVSSWNPLPFLLLSICIGPSRPFSAPPSVNFFMLSKEAIKCRSRTLLHDFWRVPHCHCAAASSAGAENLLEHLSDTTSRCFGGVIRPIRSDPEEDSFLSNLSVPTFAVFPSDEKGSSTIMPLCSTSQTVQRKGLEAIVPGAFVLKHALSKEICEEIIHTCENLKFGNYQAGKNNHGAMQIVVSQTMADSVFSILAQHMHSHYFDYMEISSSDKAMLQHKGHRAIGINKRWRIYRYAPGGQETFAPHIDAGFPSSGIALDGKSLQWDEQCVDNPNVIVSRLTVLMYLNDGFMGGHTKFYSPLVDSSSSSDVIASVKPEAGSMLIFPQAVGEDSVEFSRMHWPTHEGSSVMYLPDDPLSTRPKYVIRSDVLFSFQQEGESSSSSSDDIDPLTQYDHLVRDAFLPRGEVFNKIFLSHVVHDLYNPHMGVENVGPMLYAFVRFTKVRHVVEIGSGYTSVWILQALKDNEEEMNRIKSLQNEGKCRLMDWPWTVPSVVSSYNNDSASLICVDNCLHQRETASKAVTVANVLGLSSYLKFIKGDAYEMTFEEESVDLLWCDFGVGPRMKEFVSGAWKSIRSGGFLICHSTLTNERTREWLESIRRREGEEKTGIPDGEVVEISLLEPHKHYQNSISILQRRKSDFKEPLYSEYA